MTRAYLWAVCGLLLTVAVSAGSERKPALPQLPPDRKVGAAGGRGDVDRMHYLEKVLLLPVTVSYREAPLSKVIDDLQTLTGVNLVIDRAALADAGVGPDHPVTINSRDLSLKTTLNLLLKPVRLTYLIKDEVVQITTPEVGKGPLKLVTYHVADLVIPIGSEPPLPVARRDPAPGKAPSTYEGDLLKLIATTVEPQSWSEAGGKGTIQYYPLGHGLVVSQTQDVQEQVQDLLAALRAFQEHHFKSYVVEVAHVHMKADGKPQTQPWPRVTLMLTRPVTVSVGAVVKLHHGSVRDLLGAAGGQGRLTCAAEECEPPAPADELRVGKAITLKLTRAEEGKLKLDVLMQENEVEEANRDGLTVTGHSVRTVRRVESGKQSRVVLKRDADGTARQWLEVVVREPAAEPEQLPMPRKLGPAATQERPVASPSTAR
jgi:hypothetical protein